MSASSGWPAWPGGRGSPSSSPRLSWNKGAAHLGRARWGARSARRPPGAGPREDWWCWDIPGQEHPLHFVQDPLRQLQHRVWDSLHSHSSRQLEARRPLTFGGVGNGADGVACRAALRAASTEREKSLLRGLLAGAMWTAAGASGHGMGTNSACSHCGAAHEDEAIVLRECPEWDDARGTWLPWLSDAAGAIPPPRTAGPVAVLPAQSGPLSPPAGAGSGPGPPRRVPVPPIRHLLAGPRCSHGSPPGGPAGPRGLPLSGTAAPAAPQPPPLGRLRRPLAGGRRVTPTAAPVGDGPRTSSTSWSSRPGRSPGCRGRRQPPGPNWLWTMKRSWGVRSRPPRTTGCGARACHWPK